MNQVTTFEATRDVAMSSGINAFEKNAFISSIFKRSTKATSSIGAVAAAPKSREVSEALNQGDELVSAYQSLKTEFFDRSDRALWNLLDGVYDFVCLINKSVQKRQIKSELITAIKTRDGFTMSSSSETEAIAVRYVFGDLARQTRNNYVIVMEKALALGIEKGQLLGFLEQHKGVVNVVEKNFDEETGNTDEDKDARKAQRTESINWIRRLFAAMSHSGASTPVSTAQVADWTPTAEELANVKDSDKASAKYQPGNFVFFVALPSHSQGAYNLVQGFNATLEFENQLLQQIATRMGASNEELQATVTDIEASLAINPSVSTQTSNSTV